MTVDDLNFLKALAEVLFYGIVLAAGVCFIASISIGVHWFRNRHWLGKRP